MATIHFTRRAALLALLFAGGLRPAAALDAQALLAASDAVRNPGRPFSVNVLLNEFQDGQRVGSSTLVTYSRTLEKGGQFASLVQFVAPARDAGKLMLKNGNDLWFYDPNTKTSVRLAPQQRLLGQASNGDVLTVNLARDYKAELGGEETITDGERQERATYRLDLTASSEDATYSRIELWVDQRDSRPVKGKFYADSGRLLKLAYYRRYQRELGTERPTELVIVDGLNPRSVTLMRLADYKSRQIPETWYERDALPRFQPE